jgi:hypothetical protein
MKGKRLQFNLGEHQLLDILGGKDCVISVEQVKKKTLTRTRTSTRTLNSPVSTPAISPVRRDHFAIDRYIAIDTPSAPEGNDLPVFRMADHGKQHEDELDVAHATDTLSIHSNATDRLLIEANPMLDAPRQCNSIQVYDMAIDHPASSTGLESTQIQTKPQENRAGESKVIESVDRASDHQELETNKPETKNNTHQNLLIDLNITIDCATLTPLSQMSLIPSGFIV